MPCLQRRYWPSSKYFSAASSSVSPSAFHRGLLFAEIEGEIQRPLAAVFDHLVEVARLNFEPHRSLFLNSYSYRFRPLAGLGQISLVKPSPLSF